LLQLTRRYLRQIDGIFLALCAACSVLSVVTLVSIGHNQLGSINKASVQFIASALGILLALIVSTVDYRALARAWPLHAVLAWGMVLPTLLLHNVRLGFLTVGYDAGGTSNYSWYRVGGMTGGTGQNQLCTDPGPASEPCARPGEQAGQFAGAGGACAAAGAGHSHPGR